MGPTCSAGYRVECCRCVYKHINFHAMVVRACGKGCENIGDIEADVAVAFTSAGSSDNNRLTALLNTAYRVRLLRTCNSSFSTLFLAACTTGKLRQCSRDTSESGSVERTYSPRLQDMGARGLASFSIACFQAVRFKVFYFFQVLYNSW